MQKVISYLEFAKTWGIMGFRRETGSEDVEFLDYDWFKDNYTSFKGNPPSIIDAWEKFFDEGEKDTKNSNFFKEWDLPFYSKDLPFVFIEFPKELKTLDNYEDRQELIDLSNTFSVSEKDIPLEQLSYFSELSREKHKELESKQNLIEIEELTDLYPGGRDHVSLYASAWPKKLLRWWLRDWDSWKDVNDSTKKEELSFYPFEIKYYDFTSQSNEKIDVNVLKRWHNGKTYRMWIFNKRVSAYDITPNREPIYIYGASDDTNKTPIWGNNIYWPKNFLLGIMSWYWYSYKPGHMNSVIYNQNAYRYPIQDWLSKVLDTSMRESVRKVEVEWNLLDIYRNYNLKDYWLQMFHSPEYVDSMPKWIKAWFTGEGREGYSYWWSYYPWFEHKFGVKHYGRIDRINWVWRAYYDKNWGDPENNVVYI